MKYIKYLVFIMFVMFIGINGVSAKAYNSAAEQSINVSPLRIIMPQKQFQTSNGSNDVNCTIFGSKNDPESLRSLIDEILMYPKIIIPAIVIGFGVLDFAKAVTSSKEDEMRKATKTFAKRVIIGMCVFLVPVIIDVIMYLADLVWSGRFTTCGI